MKIGDRVIYHGYKDIGFKKKYYQIPAIITNVNDQRAATKFHDDLLYTYRIKFDFDGIKDPTSSIWVSPLKLGIGIELDTKWYREDKLKQLLDEI